MKQRITITMLLLWILSSVIPLGTAFASPITIQQAQQNAMDFLKKKGKTVAKSALTDVSSKDATTKNYYVFNVGNNEGFVIASADDQVPAILGYANKGTVLLEAMPANLKAWLDSYDKQIRSIQEQGLTGNAPITSTHAAISPLMTTTWDQDDPYNQSCPDFFSYGKSVTGCVATAMAQVMYYHRNRSVNQIAATIPAYTCQTQWNSDDGAQQISVAAVPAGSVIDWNNMLTNYTGSETATQKKAVADLMFYCGASVSMNYANSSNGGSGAYSEDVPVALKTYFGYSDNTQLVSRDDYTNDSWDNLIYNELSNHRPVFYSGVTSSGGGHAFVCDGYDSDGYYHINWGWGGYCDTYFLLSDLTPQDQGTGGSSGGYNTKQKALIGAEPSGSITPSVEQYTVSASITPINGGPGEAIYFYDRNGNDITNASQYVAGSYVRIVPSIPASSYIREIIVNGVSIGTWNDDDLLSGGTPNDYTIDNLSSNIVIEFVTYLYPDYRTLRSIANGPGVVKMYKNGNYIGTTTQNGSYYDNVISNVFDTGDILKLVFVPDEGCQLSQLLGSEHGTEYGYGTDYTSQVSDNTFTVAFDDLCLYREMHLDKFFEAYFERVESSVILNETNFPDATFRAYISTLTGVAEGGTISEEKLLSVKSIDISGRYDAVGSITDLKGIEYFTALTSLNCVYNQLTSLDVSKNTVLTSLYCSKNQLTSLDVSKNTVLTLLECVYNQLTSLDISKNTTLTDLSCYNNQLMSLDVSMNTALNRLSCTNNQLTCLDVSKNIELTWLECAYNQLTSLNVSKNIALTELHCNNNQLTSLDVSNNTTLTFLNCSNNQLTSLDVSKNTALTSLSCSSNQLTNLDVSKNTTLALLDCFKNQLMSLDVSKNNALKYLQCSNNQLTSLGLSKNTDLRVLLCHNNQLMCLDTSMYTELGKGYNSPTLSFGDIAPIVSPQTLSLSASSFGSNEYFIPVPLGFNRSKVSEFKVNGVNVTPIVSDGRLFLTSSSTPQTLTYKYDTDNSVAGKMDVTVSITEVKRQYRVCVLGSGGDLIISDINNKVLNNSPREFYYDEGSYLKISYTTYAIYCVKDILVNGTSVGVHEHGNSDAEYIIENLSCDMNIEFVTDYTDEYKTLKCNVIGRGTVKLYKNDVCVDNDRGTVFDKGDRVKLVFEPEDGCVLSSLTGFDYDPDYSIDFTSSVKNNTYTSIAFDGVEYDNFVRNYLAVFDGPSIALSKSNFPDAKFRSYLSSLTGVEEEGLLADEALKSVESIHVQSMGITSLQGIEFFSELRGLECSDNELKDIDLTKNAKLYQLYCSNNQLTSLDVSKNVHINQLICRDNQLTSINVSNVTFLYGLSCSNNHLMFLDLSNCTMCLIPNHYLYMSPQSVSLVASSQYPNQYNVRVPAGFDINRVFEFKVNGIDTAPSVMMEGLFEMLSFTSSSIPQIITYQYDSGNSEVGQLDFIINVTSIDGLTYENTIYMDDMEVLSGTEALLSVKMKNTVVPEGFEFDMYLPEGITVVQDEDGFPEVTLSTERTTARKTNSFDAIFNADGSLRVLAASTNGSAISGNDGEVVQVKVAIADDMAEGDYTVCFKNIAISDENATSHTSAMTTSTIKVNAYIVGDANIDKKVDVADFTAVAHHLLNNTPQSFHQKAADANTDNRIDVGDLTAIAHLILYGTITKPTNTSGAKPFMMMNGSPADENYIYIEPVSVQGQSEVTLSVKMRNAVEAEGFEFDLYLPDGMSFVTDEDGFAEVSLSTERTNLRKTNSFDAVIQEDGSLRVLAASTNGSSISGNDGEVALVTIHIDPNLAAAEYPLLLKNIAIADVNAVSHSTDLKESTITILGNGIVTGLDGVGDLSGTEQWYSLDGKKLNSKPKAKGVYIMNGQKVVIK